MNTNGLICFEQFFEFYKDFSIFPDIVNMNQIKNIFFMLSETLIKELNSTKGFFIIMKMIQNVMKMKKR